MHDTISSTLKWLSPCHDRIEARAEHGLFARLRYLKISRKICFIFLKYKFVIGESLATLK